MPVITVIVANISNVRDGPNANSAALVQFKLEPTQVSDSLRFTALPAPHSKRQAYFDL